MMPGPAPHALWFEESNGRLSVFYECYLWSGKEGNRKARAIALVKRKMRGDWRCRWCGDELPVWRRADARY